MTAEQQLDLMILETIRKATGQVTASWIAAKVLLRLDPELASPEAVRNAAYLGLRRRAATILEIYFQPAAEVAEDPRAIPDMVM
jgi:hypothetical protein